MAATDNIICGIELSLDGEIQHIVATVMYEGMRLNAEVIL